MNGCMHVLLFLDIDAICALLGKEVNGQTYMVWLWPQDYGLSVNAYVHNKVAKVAGF